MSQPEETQPEEAQPEETQPEEREESIRLDQFLKLCGVATGGQAKQLIQSGQVLVNGEVETRRSKKLRIGDEVVWENESFVVSFGDAEEM
ncbi:MAG: RNA-binding S4 domain-containing protein [Planctomycetales bacterium]|nr:RNA-binding S4 domain-containing protein [Planctomycetales bacterium]